MFSFSVVAPNMLNDRSANHLEMWLGCAGTTGIDKKHLLSIWPSQRFYHYHQGIQPQPGGAFKKHFRRYQRRNQGLTIPHADFATVVSAVLCLEQNRSL
jgi:hypothetical protein